MQINDELWAEMQAQVEARVAKENASAAERGSGDKFAWQLHDGNEFSAIITTYQREHGGIDRKAVGRDKATGRLLRVTLSVKKLRLLMKAGPAPKAWAKLAGKSATEIVKGVGITGWIIFLSVKPIARETTEPVPAGIGEDGRSWAVVEEREGGFVSYVRDDGSSNMTMMAVSLPGEMDRFPTREAAEANAEVMRKKNAERVEATKRQHKHGVKPATYTVIECTPEQEARIKELWRNPRAA